MKISILAVIITVSILSLRSYAGDRLVCYDAFGKSYESCEKLYSELDASAVEGKKGRYIPKRFESNKAGIPLSKKVTIKREVSLNSDSGSVKVMSINIGSAALATNLKMIAKGIRSKEKKISEYDCPNLKLCHPELANNIREHFEKYNPDVIFIQEAQGPEQLTDGTNLQFKEIVNENNKKEIVVEKTKIRPVLPVDYDVVCNAGHLGVIENCVAWNKKRVQQNKNCRSVVELQGGAILCPLEIDKQEIQFVSVHPAAWFLEERAQTLVALWSQLIDRKKPAIVGGDFNNLDNTFGFATDKPYPEEFYTLFGKHVANYGAIQGEETFFGTYKVENENGTTVRIAETLSTTIYPKIAHPNQLDHVFSNFGRPEVFSESEKVCKNKYACLGAHDDGYEYKNKSKIHTNTFAKSIFYKLDHRPVFSKITWGKN